MFFRSKLENAEENDYYFLTQDGHPFMTNYMSKAVRDLFGSIGIIKSMNCTSFKKAAVIHVTDNANGTQQTDLTANGTQSGHCEQILLCACSEKEISKRS